LPLSEGEMDEDDDENKGGDTLALARTPFQPGPGRIESSWLLLLLVALVRTL
jgi:hypothetical protein